MKLMRNLKEKKLSQQLTRVLSFFIYPAIHVARIPSEE